MKWPAASRAVHATLTRGYGAGALRAVHRFRNKRALTAIGLHRVLPRGDERWHGAMAEFTVDTDFFRDLLDFVDRHYSFVSLEDVIAAADGRARLPPCPALLTFDDGWADTADVALPILESRGIPSVVFTVADRVGAREGFWQTEWWAVLQAAPAPLRRDLLTRVGVPGQLDGEHAVHAALERLEQLPLATRWQMLHDSGLTTPDRCPRMVDAETLTTLPERGMAVAMHGYTHEPMTRVEDLGRELVDAREVLGRYLAPLTPAAAMSFPHGRYGPAIVSQARTAGYELLFTSVPVLTPIDRSGRLHGPLVGRIWAGHSLLGSDGRLDEIKASGRFFFAPTRSLETTPAPPFDQ